jgi:DNA-binding NarL/FixJ family response regulator
VTGFVAKGSSPAELANAIRMVVRGEVAFVTSAGSAVIEALVTRPRRESDRPYFALTSRQRRIVELLHSKTNKEIAQLLGIEVSTVKNHVHNILAKLGVRRRRDVSDSLPVPIVRPEQRS